MKSFKIFLDEKLISREGIMANWIKRGDVKGLTLDQFKEELPRLRAAKENKDAYIQSSRVGASFTMNRQMKLSLWSSWENARNHETFDQ